jgi:chromosome segregation ATPase
MPLDYINTPQTHDATYLTNGLDRLGEMSPEKSFFEPRQKQDLISQMRSTRQNGMNLKTPRVGSRDPLRLLPNGNNGKGEFTPLMKSVTKNNHARRMSARKSGVETPAALRNGYQTGATPALPRMDEHSHLGGDHANSSAMNDTDFTPLPQNLSSSAQSTPLAQLPSRNGGAVVNDGNMMTLREQEGMIDKIEKENFGLKMKIHFLEDAMSKRGGDFNAAALRENTDLKVAKVTMQKELHKFKKNIAQAERDAEVYRLQLEEYREKIKRRHADEATRAEIDKLHEQLKQRDEIIERFEDEQESSKSKESGELQRLRDELLDLQADMREKERELETREDELDDLKTKARNETNLSAELEDELETAKQKLEDMQQKLERAQQDASDANDDREDAFAEKRKAEQDLEELQDEMANKSFTTKGLSRQLEDKTAKLEEELEDLRERFDRAHSELEEKSSNGRQLQDRIREMEKEIASGSRGWQQELETAHQQRDTFERKLGHSIKQVESLEHELRTLKDEKDLLQSRHNALTTESAQLQKDLAAARQSIQELDMSVEEERRRAAHQDNLLRTEHQHEVDLLNEQVDTLHRQVNSKSNDHAADLEEWEAKRKTLESSCAKAEERANGLQRTVDRLQDAQGTLSGREMRLQEALESEKQRHLQEEKVLSIQVEELQADLAAKRKAAEDSRIEVNNAKEELRISIRDQAALKEKVGELEEEIEVLQADMDQEHELLEQLQKKSHESVDGQVSRLRKEKQTLQDSLAKVQIDLSNARRDLSVAESDKEELEGKVNRQNKSPNDTFNVDTEKRDLKRAKQKLEKDIDRLTLERNNLAESNRALDDELSAELERAAGEELRLQQELDQLRSQRQANAEHRDRDLTAAKNKATRLEARVRELESVLDNQSKVVASPGTDISGLRHDLADARQRETTAAKRESELKAANRDLRMQVHDLEGELHDARLAQLKTPSPSASPPPSHSKELARVRQDLVDSRAELKAARDQIKELERSSRRPSLAETEQTHNIQARLKFTTAEAKELNAKVIEQENVIAELQLELDQIQSHQQETRNITRTLKTRETQIRDLEAQLDRLNASNKSRPAETQHDVTDISVRLSARDSELMETKRHLTRIRNERRAANEKAEAVENELEILQSRYEGMLEKLSSGRHSRDEVREKEMRGLLKEIGFLKARCKRAERLRKDAAWAKEWVKREEEMRVKW